MNKIKISNNILRKIIREEIRSLNEFDSDAYNAKMKKYWLDFQKALKKEIGRSKEIDNLKFIKFKYSGVQSTQEFHLDWGGKTFEGWVTDESSDRGEKVNIEFFVKGRGSYSWKKSGRNASPEGVAHAIRTYFESGGKKK